MVQQNNSYNGLGQNYIDAYIRNIEEFRRGVENSLLPIVSFFIANSESDKELNKLPKSPIVMPVSVLADNKEYLQSLGQRYFKRDFDFIASDTERLKVYDVISNVIHRSRKAYQYAYCDLMDILFLKPDLFDGINLPSHVIYNSKINVKEYNHKLPKFIEKAITPKEFDSNNNLNNITTDIQTKSLANSNNMSTKNVFDVAIQNKFPTPVHLYAYVLSDIKKSIDFEILKLYDYLCENSNLTIRSNKLIKIYEELKYIGEVEYTKIPFKTRVLPANDLSQMTLKDICLNELSANITRGIDAKTILADDLIRFMNHPEGKELKSIFHRGYYPELQALVHQHKR